MAQKTLARSLNAQLVLETQRLQATRPADERLAPPTSSKDVFDRTVEIIELCARWKAEGGRGRTPNEWLTDWFPDATFEEIWRQNVFELYAWAFYCKDVQEVSKDQRVEINAMIDECIRRFNWNLRDGYNPAVKPIRINFDHIKTTDKGMKYYAGMQALAKTSNLTMAAYGFAHKGPNVYGVSYYHCKTLRHGLRRTRPRINSDISRTDLPPVVFIHGLGVGLAPYLPFVRRIATTRETFSVELPEIEQVGSVSVLPPTVMADGIVQMLLDHGHKKAVFVAHSYGTAVLTWVCRNRPECVLKAVFLDPICFILCQPDVVNNFLYRDPDDAMTKIIANLVRWELFQANVLFRHFYWYHNNLWFDEIPENTTVMLSDMDHIIDPYLVRRYLEEYKEKKGVSSLDIQWLEGVTHGGFAADKAVQKMILSWIGCPVSLTPTAEESSSDDDFGEEEAEEALEELGSDEEYEAKLEKHCKTPKGRMRLMERLQSFTPLHRPRAFSSLCKSHSTVTEPEARPRAVSAMDSRVAGKGDGYTSNSATIVEGEELRSRFASA